MSRKVVFFVACLVVAASAAGGIYIAQSLPAVAAPLEDQNPVAKRGKQITDPVTHSTEKRDVATLDAKIENVAAQMEAKPTLGDLAEIQKAVQTNAAAIEGLCQMIETMKTEWNATVADLDERMSNEVRDLRQQNQALNSTLEAAALSLDNLKNTAQTIEDLDRDVEELQELREQIKTLASKQQSAEAAAELTANELAEERVKAEGHHRVLAADVGAQQSLVRSMFGIGVYAGLTVKPDAGTSLIRVEPGTAIDAQGRFLILDEEQLIDPELGYDGVAFLVVVAEEPNMTIGIKKEPTLPPDTVVLARLVGKGSSEATTIDPAFRTQIVMPWVSPPPAQ